MGMFPALILVAVVGAVSAALHHFQVIKMLYALPIIIASILIFGTNWRAKTETRIKQIEFENENIPLGRLAIRRLSRPFFIGLAAFGSFMLFFGLFREL